MRLIVQAAAKGGAALEVGSGSEGSPRPPGLLYKPELRSVAERVQYIERRSKSRPLDSPRSVASSRNGGSDSSAPQASDSTTPSQVSPPPALPDSETDTRTPHTCHCICLWWRVYYQCREKDASPQCTTVAAVNHHKAGAGECYFCLALKQSSATGHVISVNKRASRRLSQGHRPAAASAAEAQHCWHGSGGCRAEGIHRQRLFQGRSTSWHHCNAALS